MSRIEDYAIIGDLHTAAMAGVDGSIDWCLPRFDSPACFAAVVETREKGTGVSPPSVLLAARAAPTVAAP